MGYNLRELSQMFGEWPVRPAKPDRQIDSPLAWESGHGDKADGTGSRP